MYQFIRRHENDIHGVLSGFDRIRFRGTIRWFGSVRGVMTFLWKVQVRLTQFTMWAKGLTDQIVETSERIAATAGRPMMYLYSSSASKEELALQVAKSDGITEGLVCVFKCVEPCHTFKVGPNAKTKKLELRQIPGKCAHYYFYMLHPQFGLLHLRLQTWLPFTIHVCMNGREWLARELRQRAIGFQQRDNCFVWIENIAAAQKLADQQLRTDWSGLLDELRRLFHPVHETMFGKQLLEIYWSADETEWATDVMFKSPAALARIYPGLVRHAITAFSCEDTLRFLGRYPKIEHYWASDIVITFKTRPEGTCVRHRLNRNSIKMYDKQETVLRIETTINDPSDMKVLRPREGHPAEIKTWQKLRKGVADLHRRAEVSQKSNERYLDALAAVHHDQPLGETVKELCQPTELKGRRVRALQPLSPDDNRLLVAVNRGEFAINGFRNRDLRGMLYGATEVAAVELKRQGARTTRQIRMLRAHKLIRKVPKTHRYTLTSKGRLAINALLAAQQSNTQQLAQLAV
jgi:KaiC/GvpD/RAD55 family RecA-like ATPase